MTMLWEGDDEMSLEIVLKDVSGRLIEGNEVLNGVRVTVFMWFTGDVRNVVVRDRDLVIADVPVEITDGYYQDYCELFEQQGMFDCDRFNITDAYARELYDNDESLVTDECSDCRGSGVFYDMISCGSCDGEGTDVDGEMCDRCEGTGEEMDEEGDNCPECDGSGFSYLASVSYSRWAS